MQMNEPIKPQSTLEKGPPQSAVGVWSDAVAVDSKLQFSLRGFTPYLIARVGSLMEQAITPKLNEGGLGIDTWRILMVLRFNGPMSLTELSRTTGVTTSTLSRQVGRLVDQGLVSRRRSTKDSRAVRVRLRRDGEALFDSLWPTVARLEALVTGPFDADELAQLKSALQTIESVLVCELQTARRRGSNQPRD